jgi:hypothetical protein
MTAEDLKNAWNVNRGELPTCLSLEVRNRKALATARVVAVDDLPRWVKAIKKAAESPFTTGRVPTTAQPFGFIANFDWLIKPDTLILIEEGQFDSLEVVPPDTPSPKDLSYWDGPKFDFRMTKSQILRCQVEGRLQRKIELQTHKAIRVLVQEGLYSWPYRYILDGADHPYASKRELEDAEAEVMDLRARDLVPVNPFGVSA